MIAINAILQIGMPVSKVTSLLELLAARLLVFVKVFDKSCHD